MTVQGQSDRPPPLEGFAGQQPQPVLLVILNLALPALPEGAVPGVPVESVGVLTDVLPDRCQDVVAGGPVMSGPTSLAPVLSVLMGLIVFLPASHAASYQTGGLQVGGKNLALLIVSRHSLPTTLCSSLPSTFLVRMIIMLVVMMVVVVMTMYWTVVSSYRLLHDNILGIGGFPDTGNGVSLL